MCATTCATPLFLLLFYRVKRDCKYIFIFNKFTMRTMISEKIENIGCIVSIPFIILCLLLSLDAFILQGLFDVNLGIIKFFIVNDIGQIILSFVIFTLPFSLFFNSLSSILKNEADSADYVILLLSILGMIVWIYIVSMHYFVLNANYLIMKE